MSANELSEKLIQSIEEFYLPRHLVKAIYDIGHIPADSRESHVGVGFIDIADYTHLSKFLSPKENQILLNGLYTAFLIVLERHGGYLNKIEGDSMMFHFDDVIDKRLWGMSREERITWIARELFYTCVEMQRVCILFNQAHDDFLDQTAAPDAKQALAEAFGIIKALRNKDDIASTLFAFFQIRIRIGANVGEVTIGNFGPSGSKHWDIIGLPVINAKRMESTAPVGGLRISAEFYDILSATNIADEYHAQFVNDAEGLGSVYRNIQKDELFAYRKVVIQEKKGAVYKTYTVQVYPALPEFIAEQAEELLNHGEQGSRQVIDFFKYYRGNRYVMTALEKMLEDKGVEFRKNQLLATISPKTARAKGASTRLSLYRILNYMDMYMDYIRNPPDTDTPGVFLGYEAHMANKKSEVMARYEKRKKRVLHKTYLKEAVIPLVYASLEASIREYQLKREEPEEAESV